MNVEFTNQGGDGKRKTAHIADYIRHRLSVAAEGQVETAQAQADAAHDAIARLVHLLVAKGILTLQDVGSVVGPPWNRDDLRLSAGPRDFFAERAWTGVSNGAEDDPAGSR